jgi:predicted HNH restriction endonuclease
MLVFEWREGITGCKDLIPGIWFTRPGTTGDLTHIVLAPGNKFFGHAACSISVHGSTAIMNYGGEYAEQNETNEMEIGCMKVVFHDDTRKTVKEVQWQDEGADGYTTCNIIVTDLDDLRRREGFETERQRSSYVRDPIIRRAEINDVLGNTNHLACEVCDFDFEVFYGEIGRYVCEVHHRVAVNGGERNTSLTDLAILCSNCHTIIHRYDFDVSIDEIKQLVKDCRTSR